MTDNERPACATCGRQLSGRGTAPADGKRYCTKRDCRAARDRAAYARRAAADDVPMESRPCSRCGESMQSRPRRVTDTPLGRWCSKQACRLARRKQLAPEGIARAREQYRLLKEIMERFEAAVVEPCECGLPVGRVGFMHRDQSGNSITGWCTKQGGEKAMPIPAGWAEAFEPGGAYAEVTA